MKAALYCRVSTEEQANEGFSISAQVTELKMYCDKNNIEVHQAYIDEGISGTKENRPQFQAMLKDAEKGLFNIILVHKFDRFARKVELSQRVKNQLKKKNINVVSITEPLEDSPMGFFVSGLHDLLAEYYIKNLAQESKKGHIERARQGLHNGSVPYGYKIDRETGQMIINEEQAKIVKWIFDMYNNDGYGTSKISVILNQHGIQTAVEGKWAHYTVNRIIKNVKYTGKIYYDGEVYQGTHEPMITEEEFLKAQGNRKDRTWLTGYRGCNYNKFLFLGFLRCGLCGKAFTIQDNRKSSSKRVNSSYYYKCNTAKHIDAKNPCTHTKSYQTVILDKELVKVIKKITKNTKIKNLNIKEKNPIGNVLDNQKSKLDTELDRAKKAYLAGIFTLEEYSLEKQRIELQLHNIEISKEQTKEDEKIKRLQQKINTLWDKFESADTIAEKKSILKEFIDYISVSPDSINIYFVL